MTRIADLTPRQQEVVDMTVRGYRMQEIADLINRSYEAVSNAKDNARKALGIETDMQLFAFALREKLRSSRSMGEKLDIIEAMLDEVLP